MFITYLSLFGSTPMDVTLAFFISGIWQNVLTDIYFINIEFGKLDLNKKNHILFFIYFNFLHTSLNFILTIWVMDYGVSRRKQTTCHKPLTNFITYCCIENNSPWVGSGLTTLIVIGTDCISSCNSNYHTISTTAPTFTI